MGGENKELNQLIIIGNGFDLRCGLASQYQDFFKQRYNFAANAEAYESLAMVPDYFSSLPSYDHFAKNLGDHNFSCLTLWDLIIMNVLYGHSPVIGVSNSKVPS